jgi:hypothetical protein
MNIIDYWNKNHAVGFYGGKAVIYDGKEIRRLTEFKKLCNDYVMIGLENEKKKRVREIDLWLDSHDRNEFDQIVFDPGSKPGFDDRTVNTYRGLAIKPSKGRVDPFLAHLKQNVCHDNEDWLDYLIQWMAHVVQRPQDKTGVAVVLQGDEGVGKSIVAEYFGRIFGQYYKRIDSGNRITGHFNSQFKECLLCNADEAVCVYERKTLGVLKSLITDKEFTYEHKGYDPVIGENFTNFFIISNDERIVAPSDSDRRYFVLKVKNNWKGKGTVWNKMVSMMNSTGPGALLYYLQQVHITRDLRKIPKTVWHKEQEVMAENIVKATWRQYIDEHEEDDNPDNSHRWPQDLYKDTIYAYHQAYCKEIGQSRPRPRNAFFRTLCELLPPCHETQKLLRKRCYELPSREKCLEMFK